MERSGLNVAIIHPDLGIGNFMSFLLMELLNGVIIIISPS